MRHRFDKGLSTNEEDDYQMRSLEGGSRHDEVSSDGSAQRYIDSTQRSKKQLVTKILNTTFIFNNHKQKQIKGSFRAAVKR